MTKFSFYSIYNFSVWFNLLACTVRKQFIKSLNSCKLHREKRNNEWTYTKIDISTAWLQTI